MTPKEQERANYLLKIGVPTETIIKRIKETRQENQELEEASKKNQVSTKSVLVGAAKGAGQIIKSASDFGGVIMDKAEDTGDYFAKYKVASDKDISVEQAKQEIEKYNEPKKQKEEELDNWIDETLKYSNKGEEIGGGILKTATYIAPQIAAGKLLNGATLGAKTLAQGTIGSTSGALIENDDRVGGAIFGGIGGATGELAAPVFTRVFSKRIGGKNIFGKKMKNAEDIKTQDEIINSSKNADSVENAMSKKAEIIVDDAKDGFLTKIFSEDTENLTRGEKISAVELSDEIGNKILNASKKADLHPDNPTAIETALKEAKKEINKYTEHLRETGKNIGDIKDTLLNKKIKTNTEGLKKIKEDIILSLEKKGVYSEDGKWMLDKNSAIEKSDLYYIDDILGGLDEIVENKSLKDVINRISKIDNGKIKFGEPAKISQDLNRILITTRNALKRVRNDNLTAAEKEQFKKYSEMSNFLDSFNNSDNAIKLLLKRANSQLNGETKRVSKEIRKITNGERIDRIGEVLSSVLEAGASKSDKTLLKQMMGSESDAILGAINPKGAVAGATGKILKKTFAKDKMSELEKFININVTDKKTKKSFSKAKKTETKQETTNNNTSIENLKETLEKKYMEKTNTEKIIKNLEKSPKTEKIKKFLAKLKSNLVKISKEILKIENIIKTTVYEQKD